jgi:hypothetical protein
VVILINRFTPKESSQKKKRKKRKPLCQVGKGKIKAGDSLKKLNITSATRLGLDFLLRAGKCVPTYLWLPFLKLSLSSSEPPAGIEPGNY